MNALEDYFRAAEELSNTDFTVYQSWLPPDRRPSADELRKRDEARSKLLATMSPEERRAAENEAGQPNSATVERRRLLSERLANGSYLAVKLGEVDQFGSILELIDSATSKRVQASQLGEDILEAPMARLRTSLRNVARLTCDAAYVAYAKGNSTRGAQLLLEAVTMGHRLSSVDVPVHLVGVASSNLALGAFEDHLGALDYADAREVSRTAATILSDNRPLRQMLQNEQAHANREIEGTIVQDEAEPKPDQDQSPLAKQYRALTPQQKQSFTRMVEALVDDGYKSLIQRLDGPEEDWLTPRPPSGSVDTPEPTRLDQLAKAFADLFPPPVDRALLLPTLRNRTQLRLLRLHAEIVSFRWEHGRLPLTLDELGLRPEAIYDPLSKKPFQYEHQTISYHLFSQGIPETGPIDLRYRPSSNANQDHDPDRP